MTATATGQLLYDPYPRPLSAAGLTLPQGYYNFLLSGTTTPAPVYQNATLTTPYPAILLPFLSTSALYNAVQADGTGTFQPIFLNPTLIYRVQLYSAAGQLLEDNDPYVPQMPSVGNGQLIINAQGEFTIAPPVAGGTGITLTVIARSGVQAVQLTGSAAGTPALIANNTVLVGTQTATFSATNKPGSGTTAPTKWLPILCDGGTYYLPLWL
jgi:hypothetical protein